MPFWLEVSNSQVLCNYINDAGIKFSNSYTVDLAQIDTVTKMQIHRQTDRMTHSHVYTYICTRTRTHTHILVITHQYSNSTVNFVCNDCFTKKYMQVFAK